MDMDPSSLSKMLRADHPMDRTLLSMAVALDLDPVKLRDGDSEGIFREHPAVPDRPAGGAAAKKLRREGLRAWFLRQDLEAGSAG